MTHWGSPGRNFYRFGALGTFSHSAEAQKLSAYPRQNGLALAVRELGRIERTIFTLRKTLTVSMCPSG
jgi:hypothetical protein